MNHSIHGATFESEAEAMDAAQIKNAQKNVSFMLECFPEHGCYTRERRDLPKSECPLQKPA